MARKSWLKINEKHYINKYSKRHLAYGPDFLHNWTVLVADNKGNILKQYHFKTQTKAKRFFHEYMRKW